MKQYSKIRIPIPITALPDNFILGGIINKDGYLGKDKTELFKVSKHLKDFYDLLIKSDPI